MSKDRIGPRSRLALEDLPQPIVKPRDMIFGARPYGLVAAEVRKGMLEGIITCAQKLAVALRHAKGAEHHANRQLTGKGRSQLHMAQLEESVDQRSGMGDNR